MKRRRRWRGRRRRGGTLLKGAISPSIFEKKSTATI